MGGKIRRNLFRVPVLVFSISVFVKITTITSQTERNQKRENSNQIRGNVRKHLILLSCNMMGGRTLMFTVSLIFLYLLPFFSYYHPPSLFPSFHPSFSPSLPLYYAPSPFLCPKTKTKQ